MRATGRARFGIGVACAVLVGLLGGSTASQGLGGLTWLNVGANTEHATCGSSLIDIDFKLDTKDPVGDGDGLDYGIMVIFDGTGTAIYSDHFTGKGKHLYTLSMNFWRAPTARPLTIKVYDVSFVVTSGDSTQAQVDDALTGVLLDSYRYDPGDDLPVCASLISTETLLATIPAAPGSLDHGSVLVGQISDLDLTVRNDGVTPSDLDGSCPAATAPHGLTGGGDFGPLGVGETDTCTYFFRPTIRASAADAITVTSDGGSAVIDLLGTGVAPLVNLGDPEGSAYTRIGTSSEIRIPVTNDGDGNLSGLGAASNLLGAFPPAAGEFSGVGGPVSLPDGASTNVVYSFVPNGHRASVISILASFSNGSTDGVNLPVETRVPLAGVGVGPVFTTDLPVDGILAFGDVAPGVLPALQVEVENSTSDENGGDPDLTRLTLSGEITGADAASFELRSAPSVLGVGEAGSFDVGSTGIGRGPVSAVLTIYCDVDRPLGETTEVCAVVPLEAVLLSVIDVPDLSTGGRIFLALAFAILGLPLIRRTWSP